MGGSSASRDTSVQHSTSAHSHHGADMSVRAGDIGGASPSMPSAGATPRPHNSGSAGAVDAATLASAAALAAAQQRIISSYVTTSGQPGLNTMTSAQFAMAQDLTSASGMQDVTGASVSRHHT